MTNFRVPHQELYYLATPLQSDFPHIPYWRFIAAGEITWALSLEDIPVFSPILHSYPQDLLAKAGTGKAPPAEFWYKFDIHYMRACQAGIMIAHLPGWEASEGIREEAEWFEQKGRPRLDLSPEWLQKNLNPKTWTILTETESLT